MSDGVPITCLDRGQGPAVLFLHGLGGDAAGWQRQLDALAPSHRVLAWNMPGGGSSAALDAVTFPALADAVVRLLDSRHIRRAVLVGHSLGGMIALETAALFPGRVAGLVLAATSPAFGRADGDFQRQFIDQRIGPLNRGATMDAIARTLVPGLVGANAPAGVMAAATASMARLDPVAYRAVVECLVTFERRAALAKLTMPTTVIAGALDQTAPAAMMARMAGEIPGADFHVLADAGHLLYLEQPDAFNGILVRHMTIQQGDISF